MLAVFLTIFTVFLIFWVLQLIPFLLTEVKARVGWITTAMLICTPLLWPVYDYYETHVATPEWARVPLIVLFTFLVSTFFWFGYLQWYFSFERSPTLRFLVHHLEAKNQTLHPDDLWNDYSFDDVVRRRIEQMIEVKLLLKDKNGNLYNSPKGRLIGKFCNQVKVALKLGNGG